MTGKHSDACPRCGAPSEQQLITLFGYPMRVVACACAQDETITLVPAKASQKFRLKVNSMKTVGIDGDGNTIVEATVQLIDDRDEFERFDDLRESALTAQRLKDMLDAPLVKLARDFGIPDDGDPGDETAVT